VKEWDSLAMLDIKALCRMRGEGVELGSLPITAILLLIPELD